MTIKHLFIGGGNIYGFAFFGLLKETHLNNIWDIKNIKTIYAISAGSIIGTMISLGLEWDVIEDYLINRPWNKLLDLNMYSIINSIKNCGIFSKTEFDEILKPLFLSKDISCEITMKSFYEYTGIEHNYIVSKINTEMNIIENVMISYKTHPDWRLLDVIYMSSCLPILFSPIFIDNDIYLDGTFSFNKVFIAEITDNMDETLLVSLEENKLKPLAKPYTLFDYLLYFILFFFNSKSNNNISIDHINNYKIKKETFNLETFCLTLTDKNERMRLIHLGEKSFLNTKNDEPKTPHSIETITEIP